MTYHIFKYVKTELFGSNRPMHQIQGINNKQLLVIGIKKFIRLYKEGRIKGHLPDPIKSKLGLERRKGRSDKGKKKATKKVGMISWQIVDEFIAGPIKPNPFEGMFDNVPADENDY